MIVDTGPLVAALNRREANHDLAVSVLEQAGAAARIPTAVLIEVDHLTRQHRPHDPPVLRLVDAIRSGEHTLQDVEQEVLEAAAVLDRSHVDLQLGLTDCIAMTLAESLGQPVFTFGFPDFRAVTVQGQSLELVAGESDVAN